MVYIQQFFFPLNQIFPNSKTLLKVKFKGHEHVLGYKKGVVLPQLLSRPEKSLEDYGPECQMGFKKQRVSFSPGLWVPQIHHECSGRRIFRLWVGGLIQGHIAMGVFSEECFPCLSPTTVLVVVPDAGLHILFTPKKRRKNEEIETHSLHTSSPLDADLFPLPGCSISLLNKCERAFLVSSPNY